jgi:uncharacterized membrane protein YhaH (DUF805 family)
MKIINAYTDFWKRYVDFSGRTSRSDFWYYILGAFVVFIIAAMLDNVTGLTLFTPVLSLASIIPAVAIYTRRLHDINKTGWWQLIALIPLAGLIVLLVWFCTKGDQAKNQYGINPIYIEGKGDSKTIAKAAI